MVVLDCSPGPEQTTSTTVVDPRPALDQASSDQNITRNKEDMSKLNVLFKILTS